MKKLICASLVMSSVLCSLAYADTSTLKPGLWENKVIKNVVDGKDMSAKSAEMMAKYQQAMEKMTPEQRAAMQSHMAMASGSPGTVRICISAAMAANHGALPEAQSHCAPASVSTSGNKMSFTLNCTRDGRTTVGSGERMINGDSISTHVNMKMTDSHGTRTMEMESEMRYLGSDCKGIKPMDQIMK